MNTDNPKIRYSLGDGEQERWFDLPSSPALGTLFDNVAAEVRKVVDMANARVMPANNEQQVMLIAARICKPICDMLTLSWAYTSVERETLQEQIAILKDQIDELRGQIENKVN